MFKKTFFLLAFVALLSSCATHKYAQINHAKFYQQEYPGNVFKTAVFNTNDSITELFVQVDLNALQILSGKTKADAIKTYVFDYSLVNGVKEKEVLQTGRINLTESPDISENYLSFKIKLRIKAIGQYVLFSSLEDLNATKSYVSRIPILKGLAYSEQNFMLLNEDGSIHWDNFARGDEKLRVKVSDPSVNELYITWYAPKFSPAVVPFALVRINEMKNLESTEVSKIEIVDGISAPMAFQDLGIYLFHQKAEEKRGLSVFKFFSEFPYVVNDAQRLFALRYLNPNFEFEELMSMEPEKAVQEFWYFKSRSKERSDDMVQTYYARTQRANELFTSYKEGWKTDRGMIFMIYGEPDKVYKYNDREVWEYGYNSYYSGLRFEFSRVDNPFTQNDFSLFRRTHYEHSWQGIVDNWRTDI